MRPAVERRPELQAALAFARKHKATLIIAKLDRLARNVAFISELMEAKVDFIAVDNPMRPASPCTFSTPSRSTSGI